MNEYVDFQIVMDKEQTNLFIQTDDYLRMFFTNVKDCGSYVRYMNKLPENEAACVEDYLSDLPNLHLLERTGKGILATLRTKEFIEKCDELEKS